MNSLQVEGFDFASFADGLCKNTAMGAHGLADGRQGGADLGAVHVQLLAEVLQGLQVLLAPVPLVVVGHVPGDLHRIPNIIRRSCIS